MRNIFEILENVHSDSMRVAREIIKAAALVDTLEPDYFDSESLRIITCFNLYRNSLGLLELAKRALDLRALRIFQALLQQEIAMRRFEIAAECRALIVEWQKESLWEQLRGLQPDSIVVAKVIINHAGRSGGFNAGLHFGINTEEFISDYLGSLENASILGDSIKYVRDIDLESLRTFRIRLLLNFNNRNVELAEQCKVLSGQFTDSHPETDEHIFSLLEKLNIYRA